MDTWLLIVLIVVAAFVVCMIIGYFGDRYLSKKNINLSQSTLNDVDNYAENVSNDIQNINEIKNVIDNSMIMQEGNINVVHGQNIYSENINGMVPNNVTPTSINNQNMDNQMQSSTYVDATDSFSNSQIQQNVGNNMNNFDPNLVPFDGNFSSGDNINNMF